MSDVEKESTMAWQLGKLGKLGHLDRPAGGA